MSGMAISVLCSSAIAMHATSCGPWPSRRVMAYEPSPFVTTIWSRMLQGSTPLNQVAVTTIVSRPRGP